MSTDGRAAQVASHDYRCGACQGVIPGYAVRATAAHPQGETDCPHCGARVAKLDHASWRGWLRMALVVLGTLGVIIAMGEWPDGTWWPFALMAATSVGLLIHLRFEFRRVERVLLPVMRY